MIYKEHFIELWINGSKVELEDQESLNMRFNNVITDPTKISSNQAEYSFEFEIPATPKNNVILDYANNLGKLNKFHQRYNAEVIADGTVIFSGTITINGFKDNKYQLNLVSVKVYSLDEIFGDATMDNIPWYVPFDGVPTINEKNSSSDTDVVFPFVSYGAFQKRAKYKDNVASDYTSKFDIDQYNNWYVESFPPSHNMLATLRRAFEYKGYNVGGDAFTDERLNKIYMSTNLADGQSPVYNLGNPKFGEVNLSVYWNNTSSSGYVQDLRYPYLRTSQFNYKTTGLDPTTNQIEYNFPKVAVYDMLEEGNVTMEHSTYMYQPNEHIIVIPTDGFYKVDMDINMSLDTTNNLTAAQWIATYSDIDVMLSNTGLKLNEEDYEFKPDLRITTPIEIQLVKNYKEGESNLELIKGKNNFMCIDGKVDNVTTHGNYSNYRNFPTCFPHQKMGFFGAFNSLFMVGQITPTDTDYLSNDYFELNSLYGYVYKDNDLMAYDPIVNPDFVMGATSMGNKNGGGCAAIIKNGFSWDRANADNYEVMYNQSGYQDVGGSGVQDDYTYTDTTVNQNVYLEAPQCTFSQSSKSLSAKIYGLMYFKKNDVLRLLALHRNYNTTLGANVKYNSSGTVKLKITAVSPNSYATLIRKRYGYYTPTEFDVDLKVSNFFNKETKISDWVQQVSDAFNLEIIQNGKNVDINIRKKPNLMTAVDIDDRCNYSEAESKVIDYPKSMAVKYKIDDDEWGFERSAVNAAGGDESILNNEDWKKYADSGYTTIQLNDDAYVTSTSDKNLQFSYTWYDTFNWYAVNENFVKTSDTPVSIRIPVISKFTYMIDGYSYEESMKHDGYGLAQRFWFKPTQTPFYVWTRTYPAERAVIYLPVNRTYHLSLSYKDTERSILSEYFNINAYLASNYVLIDVYLSADEYNRIKNGALVRFDSDLYLPVEVSGYDPSGNNPTTIKMMKKVA